jgi:hypothetical protein
MPKTAHRRVTAVGRQTAELMMAAPQVVAHRVVRMATAGPLPSERDRREFHRMGAEKMAAFQESWSAMGSHGFVMQQQWARHMMSAWSAWMRLAFNPWHPGAGASIARTASQSAAQLQSIALGVAGKGLAPVHRRAVANARRLSGTSPIGSPKSSRRR